VLWERVAGAAFGLPFDVAVAADGNVFVTGYASFEAGHADAFVINLLPNGKAREAMTWGGAAGFESGNSIAVAPDGNILIAGVASAPPYVMNRVPPRLTRPDAFLIAPAGTVTMPTATVQIALGIVTTPNGSTTFAGVTDAMLLRLQQ
jgi:hypothetical protein